MNDYERLTEIAIADMARDKHKRRTTSGFERRVVKELLKEGWNVQYSEIPGIDLFSVRPGIHMKKAYRIKAHSHLSHKERDELYEFGIRTGMHVLYVHEAANREIEFIRLYPKDKVSIFTAFNKLT